MVGVLCGQTGAVPARWKPWLDPQTLSDPVAYHRARLDSSPALPGPLGSLLPLLAPFGCEGLVLIPYPQGFRLLATAAAGLPRDHEGPATGGLHEEQRLLRRMETLALRAANGTLNTGARALLDGLFQDHLARVEQVAASTTFRGVHLLDGSEDVCLQGRPPVRMPIFLDLPDATACGLGIEGTSVTTVTNASVTFFAIGSALETVAEYRVDLERARRSLFGRLGRALR